MALVIPFAALAEVRAGLNVKDVEVICAFAAIEIEPGERRDVTFMAAQTPAGREAVLSLKARLQFDRPAGYAPSMRLVLNGKSLDGQRLVNKRFTEDRVDGRMQNMAAGERLTVGYAADFDSPDSHPNYAFKRTKVCHFLLRVTDLIKTGPNVLAIENAIDSGLTNTLVVADGRVEFHERSAVPAKKGPPSGPLAVYVPAQPRRLDYRAHLETNSDLTVEFGGPFRVESDFSTPEPGWQKGSNRYFAIRREIEQRDEAIIVRDRFENLTNENVPIIQRHRITLPFQRVWLAGLSPDSRVGSESEPANPTVFAASNAVGIGLMPLDDVFQLHVNSWSDGASIGITDNQFVLRPKATHTAEWALLLAQEPDYFALVNAARRLRGVNFTIDGSFAFLRADPGLTGKWSDEQLAAFVKFKDAPWLCSSIDYPSYQGHYAHGTAFQTLDHTFRREHIARLRRIAPQAKHLVYFHCFIDVLQDADQRYADARLLHSDGRAAHYGQPHDKIFLPTERNTFGRDIARNVELIFDQIGADGVYWDEMEYSAHRYHYGEPWDGVSADIDPQTLRITRLKSSATLVTQPWRVALARRILARGPLVANGAPHTRTMADLHFPRFVETGSISNCLNAQLFTPIALGDHLSERSETDAYRVMLQALDLGCVYYWYDDVHVGIPTHPHLTRFMFPITPVELHAGVIIGRERILTNRSGLFGWGDDSQHEVHVFDDSGLEVPPAEQANFARHVTRNGQRFTELRIGEDWSAAVVRKSSH